MTVDRVQEGGLPAEVQAEMEAASAAAKADIDLQQDVRLPSLMLVQATTQTDSDAKPGQILDTLTGEAEDTVEVVPVATFKTRAYFGRGGSIGDPPTCTSPDALNGYGEVAEKLIAQGVTGPAGVSGACQRCPEADWRRGGKCQLRFNYLTVMPGENMEHDVPRGVMMHGTSAKIASRLNTLLLAQPYFWGNVISLSSNQEKNEKGQYRVWQVSRGRETSSEEKVVAYRTYQRFAESRQQGATVAVEGDPAVSPGEAGRGESGGDDPDSDIPF